MTKEKLERGQELLTNIESMESLVSDLENRLLTGCAGHKDIIINNGGELFVLEKEASREAINELLVKVKKQLPCFKDEFDKL